MFEMVATCNTNTDSCVASEEKTSGVRSEEVYTVHYVQKMFNVRILCVNVTFMCVGIQYSL